MRAGGAVAALAAAILIVGCASATAVPLPNPDPCAITGTLTDAKHQAYDKCRFDRLELAIPGNQTVTVTAPPVTVTATVTAPAVTVTATPTSSPPATTAAPTTTAATTTAATTTTPQDQPAAWPGPANTGVPAGTNITPYSGPCTITTPTTIDSKTVDCTLVIFSDVTIIRSKVNGQVYIDTDRAGSGTWRATIIDSEVDAGLIQQAAVCCGNVTLTRVNVHGGQTAAQCEETSYFCQINDSWLHGQRMPADQDWHLGGFLSDGTKGACTGTNGLCIELTHNTVACDAPVNAVDGGCTGDINFIPNFAAASNILVKHNLLKASIDLSYCTYGGEKSTSPFPHADHVVYDGNVFERGTNGMCGHYGPVTGFDPAGTGNVWTGNVWADDGSPVASAN